MISNLKQLFEATNFSVLTLASYDCSEEYLDN